MMRRYSTGESAAQTHSFAIISREIHWPVRRVHQLNFGDTVHITT